MVLVYYLKSVSKAKNEGLLFKVFLKEKITLMTKRHFQVVLWKM